MSDGGSGAGRWYGEAVGDDSGVITVPITQETEKPRHISGLGVAVSLTLNSFTYEWPVIRSQSLRTQRRRTADKRTATVTLSVMGAEKTLERDLSGTADAAIRFDELCQLLERLGFEKRVGGSHHLFRRTGVEERINLQRAGATAKPYQVKQVRSVILKARLSFQQ